VELEEWGLEVPNFEAEEQILEAEEDDYDVPDGGIETDIVIGDLFEIGEHRLLCGDSTDSDAVAKLMDGQKADMVFTDPPYGINIGNQSQGKGGGVAKKIDYGVNEWDKQIPYNAINLSLSICDNVILWGANYYSDKLPPSSCWIVWDKDNGDTDFADCELAWTSYKKSVKKFKWKWMGMLQEDMKNKEKRVHPTQKPVALAEWAFNEFQAGKNILDFFLGSGSTMVAAHQLKRKCYGLELEPKYCQVIIDRMKKLDPTLTIKRNGQII
jgi:site-specific DNA-methyltransferase (adenine-specific)